MKRWMLGIIAAVLSLAGTWAFSFTKKFNDTIPDQKNPKYTITRKWEMPQELKEISGFAFQNDDQVACIEDEHGIIYIYNLKNEKIVKKIEFGDDDDYEAIALKKNTAYVLESDGVIFEVENYMTDPKISEYEIDIDHSVNFEGLCVDPKSGNLLMITKEEDSKNDVKNVYSFDLKSKKFKSKPVYVLKTEEGMLDDEKDEYHPSAINIHPRNGDFYILDGRHPRLLILNSKFKPSRIIDFDEDDMEQPESLTFSRNGTLYISNEAGSNDHGNIMQVSLK